MTVVWQNAKDYAEEKVEVIMRSPEPEVHAFAHYRNVPDPFEEASIEQPQSTVNSIFRNPTFVEYSPDELEVKPEIESVKEEKLFDLDVSIPIYFYMIIY